jgi:hypothetical protein
MCWFHVATSWRRVNKCRKRRPCWSVTRLASITFWSLAFSWIRQTLVSFWGKILLLYSSYLPLGVPNWAVIYISTPCCITFLLGFPTECLTSTIIRHHRWWRRSRSDDATFLGAGHWIGTVQETKRPRSMTRGPRRRRMRTPANTMQFAMMQTLPKFGPSLRPGWEADENASGVGLSFSQPR